MKVFRLILFLILGLYLIIYRLSDRITTKCCTGRATDHYVP